MTIETINNQLDILMFKGFKFNLEKQFNDPNYSKLSFEQRLHTLLEAEINERENRRTKRLLSNAKLKDTTANLADIEYSSSRGLDRSVILSLANNQFINKNQK